MPEIEIFRAGTHTAMDGRALTFSAGDLDAIASSYDPAAHEAPLVVGHPKSDNPAYGWVGGVEVRGNRLVANTSQLDTAFADLVKAGRFKKVSASFYAPGSPSNPTPDNYYLRHVGFLGAQAPAVKGLRQAEFADDDGSTVTVEFAAHESLTIARLFRNLRELLIEKFGTDTADNAVPTYLVDQLQDDAVAEASGSPGFAEESDDADIPQKENTNVAQTPENAPDKDAEFAEREQKLTAREKRVQEDEAQFAERAAVDRKAGNKQFLVALVANGQTLIAAEADLLAFMEVLGDTDTVQFGEEAETPLQFFKEKILAKLPKGVDFNEASETDGNGDEVNMDNGAETTAQEAVAYQEDMRSKGIEIPVDRAVRHVIKERKN